MTTSIDAEQVINTLATRIAQLEVALAVAQAQIPDPREEIGTEIIGEGLNIMEVIDGEGE